MRNTNAAFAEFAMQTIVRQDRSITLRPTWLNVEPVASNVHVRDLRIRAALFGDGNSFPQLNWVELCFPNHTATTVSESYVADISPAQNDFDILIVVGNDIRRLRQLLRHYRPLLHAKPKIAVMSATSPRDRAYLLNAGFDEVCDTRMPVPEAQARAVSLVNRYKLTSKRQQNRFSVDPDKVAATKLTRREREVCGLLLENSPKHVNISALSGTTGNKPLTRASLRVLISKIRSKLREGVFIEYAHPGSYALVVETDEERSAK